MATVTPEMEGLVGSEEGGLSLGSELVLLESGPEELSPVELSGAEASWASVSSSVRSGRRHH